MKKLLLLPLLFLLPAFSNAEYCASVNKYATDGSVCGAANNVSCCPPDLSSPASSSVTDTTAEGSVVTDVGEGTVYACARPSTTAQQTCPLIQAGTNCTDTSSKAAAVGTISFTGVDNFSGLSTGQGYAIDYCHDFDNRPAFEVVSTTDFNTTGSVPTAAGYFVCPDGNDGAAGTSHATRWASLSKVDNTIATSTDVWLCADGTFTNQLLDIQHSGTSGDRVTVGTYFVSGSTEYVWQNVTHGAKALINYAQGTTTSDNGLALVSTQNENYITVQDLQLYSTTHTYTTGPHRVYGVDVRTSTNVVVDGLDIRLWQDYTSLLTGGTWATTWAVSIVGSSDVIVRNTTAWNNYNFITSNTSSNMLWEYNLSYRLFHNHFFIGGDENTFNLVIQNNETQDSYRSDTFQTNSALSCAAGGGACMHEVLVRDNFMWAGVRAVAENHVDLKGGDSINILRNIMQGQEGDNDGIHQDANDRSTKYSLGHGSGGAEVTTDDILVRQNIMFDNHTGGTLEDGWAYVNNTMLANNRDYTGSNSTYTNANNLDFIGLEHYEGSGAGFGATNNIFGFHNQAEVQVNNWSSGLMDGSLYCTDFSHTPVYSFDDQTNPDDTFNFADFKTQLQGDASITGDEANGAEGSCNFVALATADPAGDYRAQGYDFTPDTGSAAIDTAQPHTLADGAGSSSTSLTVDDARPFVAVSYTVDGTAYTEKDYIIIGAGAVVQIDSISGNVITLAAARTWSNNDEVWIADSAGNKLNDKGACDSDWTTTVCDVPTVGPQ